MYVPIDRFLLRAPLLEVSAWRHGRRALERNPFGAKAIEIASPDLARAAPGERRERALDRYARRAAFRSTPNGLLAGVCLGRLARTTRIATGTPRAYLAPSWGSVNAAARRLLEDPEVREKTSVRLVPSAVRGATTISWLGLAEPFGEAREAALDAPLASLVDAAGSWLGWREARALVGAGVGASADGDPRPDDGDEFLFLLLDDELLQSDLAPPLVGPPPHLHLTARLGELGLTGVAAEILDATTEQAVLIHEPRQPPTLSRPAVERAARMVPLLVRLVEALTPPAAERLTQPSVADALDAVTELYGAGAFDLGALTAGEYGVDLAYPDQDPDEPDLAAAGAGPDVGFLVSILGAIAGAARTRARVLALDDALSPDTLAALPAPSPPPTAELFLVPGPSSRSEPPGTGWLLGLHGPAGSSLGRFAHALGPPLAEALAELAEAERRSRPDEESLDVAFTPSADLADLCAHPPVRARTLALSRWNAGSDVAPRDLELVADPSSPESLALRLRADGQPITPSPLSRVRSATAPAGAPRLLVGWSLQRQQRPWALPLGPLAALDFVPRLTLEGFVLAPASWRLPAAGGRASLDRWRRTFRVPRFVQVGAGDELLPVDLDASEAVGDLSGHERVFEIWPPLDAVVDRDGRRIEAVVMLVDAAAPDAARANAEAAATARGMGRVPPPGRTKAGHGWRTFKLFGPSGRQDELLRRDVGPAIRQARAAREIDAWFFLPYVDGPGRRPHLRLRVHAAAETTAFEERLASALVRARSTGALAAVEVGEYRPELGRFKPDELPVVHAIFESESDLCLALGQRSPGLGNAAQNADQNVDQDVDQTPDRDLEEGLARVVLAARAADALARGLGFDLAAREALAASRRRAAETTAGIDDQSRRASDAAFRSVGRELRAALASEPGPPFAEHVGRVDAAARPLPEGAAARLAPTLLHLGAVRMLGPDPDGERLAYVSWQRTLEGLLAPAKKSRPTR